MTTDVLGAPIKRVEDPRFITGKGHFLDDIQMTGMTYLAILRSPYAHANIGAIDISAAKTMPGVVAVITGADIPYNPLPMAWPAGGSAGIQNNVNTPRTLATDSVKWTGEGVAAVVAETPEQAVDALEAIHVTWEPLPAVVDAEKATQPGAPQLHENAPNNIVFEWNVGDKAGTDAGDRRGRGGRPPATRQPAADPEPDGGPRRHRPVQPRHRRIHDLDVEPDAAHRAAPADRLRDRHPRAQGSLHLAGCRRRVRDEDLLLRRHGPRDVRVQAASAGARSSGSRRVARTTRARPTAATTSPRWRSPARRTARSPVSRVKTLANLGGRLSTIGPGIPTTLYARVLSGCYKIPNVYCEVTGVYTNTTFVDAYRGAGRPEATYVIERAMDLFADEIGMDHAAIRRKNFIAPDQFPYENPSGLGTASGGAKIYINSGNYAPALDKALTTIGYYELDKAKAEARTRGKYLGVGLSTYIEVCGVAPSKWIGAVGEGWGAAMWESANLKVHLTGKVILTMGTQPQGQGHETTYAQIIASELGLAMDDIIVQHSDTQGTPFGYGSYGSRTASVGGTAAVLAAGKIREKARRYAAHMLEASPDDIEVVGNEYSVKGSPDKKKTLQEIAFALDLGFSLPDGMEPYLDETVYHDTPNCTWPFGTHIALVEIDEETGEVDLVRYVAVDDVGKKVNPMIVDGQLHGGIVQGVGQALWEEAVYGDDGQLLSGTMLDYALPRASWLPLLELDETVTPSPVNPLGVKGVGEAGAIASTAAVANAVMDALHPLGIKHLDMPLTAPKIWHAIQGKEAQA